MKTRNALLLLLLVLLFFVSSCSYRSEYYYEIYDEAYSEGRRDAVMEILDIASYEYDTYIKYESIEELLRKRYGSEGEEICDNILDSPDVKLYSISDIINNLIDVSKYDYE